MDEIKVWPCLAFKDVEKQMTWLRAIGFTEHATYRDEQDPSVVVHGEWLWPGGGGIMFGSLREGGGVDNAGSTAVYLITEDPDAVFQKAVAAGGTVIRPMKDEDYGGRGGSVADPEGNDWSFGSYQPR